MHDSRLDKLAQVLVNYSVGVKKNDQVVIMGGAPCEPAAAAVYRAVLKAGGHPWVRLNSDLCREIHLKHGSDAQLTYTSPIEKYVMGKADAYITFWGDENTRYLTGVDPKRQALLSRGRKPILKMFMQRIAKPKSAKDSARWVGTQFPTNAHAQDAEMSLADYADFVFGAGKLNEKNPIAAWKKVSTAQQRLCDYLNKRKEIHITAPGGTDIRIGFKGRKWVNCDGRANFPDGEVFTGPIEDSAEGTVHYTFPAVAGGREVTDIRLTFKAGKVVDASAAKNEAFLIQMLDQDRGARFLGELALGTNYDVRNFTRNTLFDEKIGGTFHLAVGASIPESGGKNVSGLHWDMVCDLRKGGVVKVDGEVISKNGKFTRATWPHK